MGTHRWRDIKAKNMSPERIAALNEGVRRELAKIAAGEVPKDPEAQPGPVSERKPVSGS